MAKRNKKLVATSVISVALCGALLAGSSFAWFTDKVTSKDNTIQSGEFDLEAAMIDIKGVITEGEYEGAYSTLDENGKYTYVDLSKNNKQIFTAENWEPGQSDAKLIQLHNDGTLAMEVAMNFKSEGDLTDALWFSLYAVKDVDTDGDGGDDALILKKALVNKASADVLAEYLAKQTVILKADNATSGPDEFTNPDATVGFVLEYGMKEEAGNEFQQKSFSADVEFSAKQYTEEKDGFGSNQYDKDATYDNVQVG